MQSQIVTFKAVIGEVFGAVDDASVMRDLPHWIMHHASIMRDLHAMGPGELQQHLANLLTLEAKLRGKGDTPAADFVAVRARVHAFRKPATHRYQHC